MRPIKLKMSAFGPYSGVEELDFELLGKSGIYLITGDTGAGKTTIFDAIVYALYGDTSGSSREASMLRSKYADAETPTIVELEFENRDKHYRIVRNPEYERPSKKGGGTTKQKAEATLYLPNGEVVNRQNEVNSKVTEILGIDKKQFLQIAMIAQGDFLKLLLATTDQRREIFQKIFKTKPYEELQAELYNRLTQLNNQCEAGLQSIKQYVGDTTCSSNSQLKQQLALAKGGELTTEDTIALLEALATEDEKSHEEKALHKKSLRNTLDKLNAKLSVIVERKKAKQSLIELIEQRKIVNEELEKQKPDYDEAIKAWKKIPQMNVEAERLRAEMVSFQELRNEERFLKNAKESVEKAQKSIEENNKKLTQMEKKRAEDQGELEKYEGVEAKKEAILSAQKENSNRIQRLKRLQDEQAVIASLEKDLAKLKREYVELSDEKDKQQELFKIADKQFLDAQAGILASKLEDGEACPVCGSKSHPMLATLSASPPSAEKRKKLEEESQRARQRALDKSLECKEAQARLEQIKMTNSETMAELGIDGKSLLSEIELARAQGTKHKGELQELDAKIERKKQLSKQIPTLEKEIKEITNGITCVFANKASYEAIVLEKEGHIKDLLEKLTYKNEEEVSEKLERLLQNTSEISNNYDVRKKSFEEKERQLISLDGRIKQLSEQLKEESSENEEPQLLAQLEELNDEDRTLQEELDEIRLRLSVNKNAIESIRRIAKGIEAQNKERILVKELSDTAKGTIKGKEKLALETYVQMHYFDRIIKRANRRFLSMTDGQYQFKRSTDHAKQGQIGLELDVIDHYNGTERSVKTLSGGESFKASLSLALGLSDEIQSSAGGIKLDAMFIDEGFGSLDEDSLDQAIKTLVNLTEGNRIVGIISHVSELKTRIDKQIFVKKDKQGGSHATIIG